MPTGIYIRTDKIREILSLARRGKHYSKLSLALKGKSAWNKDLTKETDERVRLAAKKQIGKPSNSKSKKFPIELYPNYGNRGKHLSEEHSDNISSTLTGRKLSKQHCENISKVRQGKHLSNETKKKQRKTMKNKWKNLEFRERTVKATFASLNHKQNKKESFVDNIIQQTIPNSYCYTGDFKKQVMINGRVPDWTNTNGQKKVIEFNGIYWHLWRDQKNNQLLTKKQVENVEKLPYNEFGYDVLFIWEDELDNLDRLKNKIIEFNKKDDKNANIC